MKWILIAFSLAFGTSALGERFASPIYSPWAKPDTNPACTLYVFVSENPDSGEFVMRYRVSSLRRGVELSLDDKNIFVKPGKPISGKVGNLFDPKSPVTISRIRATYSGFRHCAGSPFDVKEFVERRSSERIFADMYDRKPEEKEYIGGWPALSAAERQKILRRMFGSRERREIEIKGYLQQFLGKEAKEKYVSFLARGRKSMQENLGEILSTPEYYKQAGATHAKYIQALYRDLIGSEPEEGESFMLMQKLKDGKPLKTVALYLISRPAFRERLVEIWWKAYLDRTPTEEEKTAALEKLDSGAPWEILQADILARDEYFQRATLTQVKD